MQVAVDHPDEEVISRGTVLTVARHPTDLAFDPAHGELLLADHEVLLQRPNGSISKMCVSKIAQLEDQRSRFSLVSNLGNDGGVSGHAANRVRALEIVLPSRDSSQTTLCQNSTRDSLK